MDFLNELTELVFLEDTPEKSDIIFIPGEATGRWPAGRQSCTRMDMLPIFCLLENIQRSRDVLKAQRMNRLYFLTAPLLQNGIF